MLENGLDEQHAEQQKHRVTQHMLNTVLPGLIAKEADSLMVKQPQPDLEHENIFDKFAMAILEGCKDLELEKVCSQTSTKQNLWELILTN